MIPHGTCPVCYGSNFVYDGILSDHWNNNDKKCSGTGKLSTELSIAKKQLEDAGYQVYKEITNSVYMNIDLNSYYQTVNKLLEHCVDELSGDDLELLTIAQNQCEELLWK